MIIYIVMVIDILLQVPWFSLWPVFEPSCVKRTASDRQGVIVMSIFACVCYSVFETGVVGSHPLAGAVSCADQKWGIPPQPRN